MSPYSYPKTKHTRTQTPKPSKRYQAYKPALRQEFRERCVYCCEPDAGQHHGYGVDHYRPKSLFPSLECSYPNLFYACNRCNTWKGSYWPDKKQRAAQQFIPNPCDHQMFEHLRYRGATVEGRTAAGIFTTSLLDLNSPDAVQHREAILAIIDASEAKRREIAETRRLLEAARKAGQISDADFAHASAELDAQNVRLDAALQHFTGPANK